MSINLIPPQLKKERQTAKLTGQIFSYGILALIFLTAVAAILFALTSYQNNQLKTVETETAELETEAQKYAELEDKILDTNRKLKRIADTKDKQVLWSQILYQFARSMPAEAQVNSISLTADGKRVSLTGEAESRKVIATFKEKLDANDYFKNVFFASSVINKTNENFSFSMTLELEKTK